MQPKSSGFDAYLEWLAHEEVGLKSEGIESAPEPR
jgi:hypothetical protein